MALKQKDGLVPFYRRQARRIDIVVQDHGGVDTKALIMVRVVFQRGGGKHYYLLKHIDDIRHFYPKEMGKEIVNAVLAAWVEYQLAPPKPEPTFGQRNFSMPVRYAEY